MFRACLIFLLSTSSLWATPKTVEVWFLGLQQTSFISHSKNLVASNNLQCQKMGEYCFDPQVGLYKPDAQEGVDESLDQSKVESSKNYEFMEVSKGVGTDLIECDRDAGFFDIFCGKAKKINKVLQPKLEVWIDVSSTMKQVDYGGIDKACKRELFLESLSVSCPMGSKMKAYSFEEYRKEVGSFDRVCLSSGLNKMSNIIRDLKNSKADHVIIITDIYEAEDRFISSIENLTDFKIKGLNKPFYASQLKDELKRVQGLCL